MAEHQPEMDKRGSSGEQMSDADTQTSGPGERVSGSTIPAQSPAGLQSLGLGESRSNESGIDPSGTSESRPHYGLGDRAEAGMGRGDEGTGGGYGSRGGTQQSGGTGEGDAGSSGMGRGDEGTGGGYGSRGGTPETGGTEAEDQTGATQGQTGGPSGGLSGGSTAHTHESVSEEEQGRDKTRVR